MQVLGISAGNPFSQKTLADSLKLPYPLLSDFPELKVIRRYGILSPSGLTALRTFFLVDEQGIVQGKWSGDAFDVFPTEDILKRAQEMAAKR